MIKLLGVFRQLDRLWLDVIFKSGRKGVLREINTILLQGHFGYMKLSFAKLEERQFLQSW